MPFPCNKVFACYVSPLKMFEYMAAERAIIASDLPTIREILDENSCAFIEPNNYKSLAEAIEKVLSDDEFAKKIAHNAFEKVQQFSWENRVKRILKLLSLI